MECTQVTAQSTKMGRPVLGSCVRMSNCASMEDPGAGMAAIPRRNALFRRSSMTRDIPVTEAVVPGGAGLAHLA